MQLWTRAFDDEIIKLLNVTNESERHDILKWFHESLIASAILGIEGFARLAVASSIENEQIRGSIFVLGAILEGRIRNFDDLKPIFERCGRGRYPHQFVGSFHNIMGTRLRETGVGEPSVAKILSWLDDHLLVRSLCLSNLRMLVGIDESSAYRAVAATKFLGVVIAGHAKLEWHQGDLHFVFPSDQRRSKS